MRLEKLALKFAFEQSNRVGIPAPMINFRRRMSRAKHAATNPYFHYLKCIPGDGSAARSKKLVNACWLGREFFAQSKSESSRYRPTRLAPSGEALRAHRSSSAWDCGVRAC